MSTVHGVQLWCCLTYISLKSLVTFVKDEHFARPDTSRSLRLDDFSIGIHRKAMEMCIDMAHEHGGIAS